MIIEGAVAHFADTKLIREGLEADLAAVRSRLERSDARARQAARASGELIEGTARRGGQSTQSCCTTTWCLAQRPRANRATLRSFRLEEALF